MTMVRIVGSVLLLLLVTTESVRADDICAASDEQAEIKALQVAAAKAEKAGKQAELFLAYQATVHNDCVPEALRAKARASLPKLGRDLAKQAETKGLLYSKDPLGSERTSAFAWLEAAREFAEADRILLKAVRNKPDDAELFKAAWNIDKLSGKRTRMNPTTHAEETYTAPPAYWHELQKTASGNADKLMAAEEKDAAGLTGNVMVLTASAHGSLQKLRRAADWMKYVPGGDKPAKARAEQRGDAIMKRGDAGLTQANALPYYEFAGASAKAAQIEAKSKQVQRDMEKSADKMKNVVSEKSEADKQKFKKGQKDLEKELGF